MAPAERKTELEQTLRAAWPDWTMPEPARARWRERVLSAAAAQQQSAQRGRHRPWWQAVAVAIVMVALAGSSSYGTFRVLEERAVARAWEERVVAITEELRRRPELWREDPSVVAQKLGAGRAEVVSPGMLKQVRRDEVLVPLGPGGVLVVSPDDDVQRLARGMRQVYWASVAAGLVPLLAGGTWLWLWWRRGAHKEVM